jgi:hypothetical protein
MMIISPSASNIKQDTVKPIPVRSDKTGFKNTPVTAGTFASGNYGNIARTDTTAADTSLVCSRNSIADVTFYDSINFITTLRVPSGNQTFLKFAQEMRGRNAEKKAILVKHLREGVPLPEQPMHGDWILPVLLVTAFIFSLIRAASGKFKPFSRFFLFRGIADPISRETGLFHWQTTILNVISIGIMGLFLYHAAVFFGIKPAGIAPVLLWLILTGVVMVAFTLRHIVCLLTGSLSGETDAFKEYLSGVHLSYHFSALVFFIAIIIISYAPLIPVSVILVTGAAAFAVMYLFRVIRLVLIFINRNISIFYLILYLCALEILPVIIIYRYLQNLN